MAINYRTAGVWGAGLGRNLAPAEHDANHYDHDSRIAALEDAPAPDNPISNITQSGSTVTIHLSDGVTTFAITLPTMTPPQVVEVDDATLEPTLVQANRYFLCSVGCVVTIPEEESVAWPVMTELHFDQDSGFPIVLIGGSDVLIEPPTGYAAETRGRGSVMTAKKIGSNRWRVFGHLADEGTG